MDSDTEVLFDIAGISVYRTVTDRTLLFQAGMEIDADGAYRAYHPPPETGLGLDYLHNAGESGNWYGLVTDSGHPGGIPVIQRSDDPGPGFFVSSTALEDLTKSRTDPLRYVDAESIPYIVLPEGMGGGAGLGDFAVVANVKSGIFTPAICADIGSRHKIGEASIAAAKAIGIPSSPREGGVSQHIVRYMIFSGSGNHKPRTAAEIADTANQLFDDWGGMKRLELCFMPNSLSS